MFVQHLNAVFTSRLGGRGKLNIYFDLRDLRGNQQIDELLGAVNRSALFLAIASPAYAQRDWTQRELAAFVKNAADTRRLFAVDYLPLDSGVTLPEPLQGHKRLKFWEQGGFSRNAMPLSPYGDVFRNRVHDLAEQIKQQLLAINVAEGTRPAIREIAEAVSGSAARRAKGIVYLAQTTDDLEEERMQVQRYLEQFGFLTLPGGELPGGGDAFRAAIGHDVAQSDLYVHLLGPRAGRYPSDVPEGYGAAQLEAAKAAGRNIVLWRHPELDLEKVADTRQCALLTDARVIACGLESFKAEVRRRLETHPQEKVRDSKQASLVFINAAESDYDVARIVQQEFSKRSMPTILPLYAGTAEQLQQDLTENIKDCDVLVILYGTAPAAWVRSQIRLFSKLRSGSHATIVAIFVGPPEGKNADVGMTMPDLRWISFPPDWSMDPVKSLIAELEG
ncbi:toll/interleukin-1 receptor domain-containing protein [Scleromatobacter humisilvae]|uniref:Toll/interleukin-1 receptor domain-containing protein n=1 Tax=Scleromatobacter humisilvae TaxID=2897159 RepID=A0A9X2BYY7_9BURK|nr:toll/interleukin-1 receptor domain-containing protein [Scleromatobacter humisilvae]MCK9686103.1 toll/interleukin-1 receptor domain-containing protein [Scleromatobacter humisilvae]